MAEDSFAIVKVDQQYVEALKELLVKDVENVQLPGIAPSLVPGYDPLFKFSGSPERYLTRI